MLLYFYGLRYAFCDLFRNDDGIVENIASRLKQHGKYISVDAIFFIRRAQCLAHPKADQPQYLVACRLAKLFVDGSKAVEIQYQQCNLFGSPFCYRNE